LLGYPIQTAGFLLGSRGVGTLLTMMVAPRLMKLTEIRNLILLGLMLTAGTLYEMTSWSLDTQQYTIVVTSIIQGVGLGLLFVPITSVAFLTLPGTMRNGAAAITTLVRNIGSSIGISMVIANLTSKTTYMHERIGASVTPFNDALQFPDIANTLRLDTEAGKAMLDGIINQQAYLIAYLNDFKLLMVLTIIVMPLVLMIGSTRKKPDTREEDMEDALHAID
jgi:DHA2 family multidrug resistance protein